MTSDDKSRRGKGCSAEVKVDCDLLGTQSIHASSPSVMLVLAMLSLTHALPVRAADGVSFTGYRGTTNGEGLPISCTCSY